MVSAGTASVDVPVTTARVVAPVAQLRRSTTASQRTAPEPFADRVTVLVPVSVSSTPHPHATPGDTDSSRTPSTAVTVRSPMSATAVSTPANWAICAQSS